MKTDFFQLFLNISSKSQLYFPIWILIVLMYLTWDSKDKLKMYSKSKIVLTYYCLNKLFYVLCALKMFANSRISKVFFWSLEQFFLFRKSEQFWTNKIPLIICHFHLIRIKSLIDASPMDGIMSIRMSAGGTDYMNGDNLIRWTEVFLLPCVLITCFHESWIFYL